MSNHDTIGMRLGQIIKFFMSGHRMTTHELAQEFGVDVRTIQRDLNERLAHLPIKRDSHKRYYLQEEALGKLGFKDVREFARLSGIGMLYPTLNDELISDILFTRIQPNGAQSSESQEGASPIMVKNMGFESSIAHYEHFKTLSVAVLRHYCVSFTYKKKKRNVKPYRLLNNNGVWYLLADDNGVLKHFTLTQITNIETLTHAKFKPDPKLEHAILQDETIWVGTAYKEAVLEVNNNARTYFFRKNFVSKPKVIEEKAESFIVSCTFSYEDEILNVTKMFLPYIRIIAPESLQMRLCDILRDYLNTHG